MNTYLYNFLAVKLKVFLVLRVCSFLHKFLIINVILMDSFLCMHYVGFSVLKISPLKLYFPLKKYCERVCVLFSPGFSTVVMMDQISEQSKPRKTADVFVFWILLYFKVIYHVTLMWYRE